MGIGTMIGALVALFLLMSHGHAHDWITGKRNVAGEYCCGGGPSGDCFVTDELRETKEGYLLPNGELVPFEEVQPSPDGAFWICRRPDGTRRCFFAPPPGS